MKVSTMAELPRFTHRTVNLAQSDYVQDLSATLFRILSQSIHDLPGIVNELNRSDIRPPDASEWTDKSFIGEMKRLGAYPNSIGAPLGEHPKGIVPAGTSSQERPSLQDHGVSLPPIEPAVRRLPKCGNWGRS